MAKKQIITEEQARFAAQLLSEQHALLKKTEAELDEKLNEIREAYSTQVANYTQTIKEAAKTVTDYVVVNPTVFAPGKKTVEWGSVVISKRITPPKVDIPRGMDWADAVLKLKETNLTFYIRTIEEVDKEAIIRAVADDDDIRKSFAFAGITVTQKETVKVEVKSEELV